MTDLSNKLENVKKTIRALLLSTPQGLTMKLLADDYQGNEGTDIPYQEFGYTTLEAFLRSMPDVVRWTQVSSRGQRGYILTGVPTESTRHIKQLVEKQKCSLSGYADPYRDLSRTGGVYRQKRNFTSAINNYSSDNIQEKPHLQNFVAACHPTVGRLEKNQIKDLILSYPKGLRLINFERAFNQMYGISFRPKTFGFGTLKECLLSLPDIVQLVAEFDCYRLYPVNTLNEDCDSEENVENVKTQPVVYSVMDDKFKYDLRRVLSLFPKGIPLSRFSSEYNRVTRSPLNCSKYGFNNDLELVSYMTDVFHVYRQSPHEDFMLFNSEIAPTEQSEERFSNSNLPCLTNDCSKDITSLSQVKDHVVEMLLKYRDGIMLNDFEEEFHIQFRDVSWKKWGYEMFKDFILALGDPVRMVSFKFGKILLIHKSNVSGIFEHAEKDSAIPDCLHGVVLPGIDYTYASTIAVNNCSDNFVPVYVSAINSPSEIYFRLQGVDDELNSLMAKLDEVYNSEKGNAFIIPDKIVKLSMICATFSPDDGTWYRGKICKFVSPVCVEVFFVDYGVTHSVNKKSLRFLTNELLCLPAQAIKARLSQVEPMNGIWTTAAKAQMLQLCPSTSVVMAKITSTSYKNTISVMLCNTSGREDVHINSVLIKNKMAIPSSDDSEISTFCPVIEDKNLQTSVGLAELSYQAQIEYYKNLNQQYDRMMQMEMPEYNGIDMKVVEMMKNDKCIKSGNGSLPEVEPSALSTTGQPAESFEQSNNVELKADVELTSSQEGHHQIRNFSKVVSLNDYDVHLINYMGKPYMTSGDISLLIWGIDVLKKMLRKKNMKDDSITLTRQTAEDLFQDLEKNKIKLSPGGKSVSLFPLESVRDVLCNFKRCEHLPKLVKMMESFDPCELHWTANFEESVDKETRTVSLLRELNEERLQILGEMKLTFGDTSRINKLRDLEERISQLYVSKKSEAKCDGDSSKNPELCHTSEQLKPRNTSEAKYYDSNNPSEQPELHHSPEHSSDVVREVTAVNPERTVIPRLPPISNVRQPFLMHPPWFVLPMYYNQMAPGIFYNPLQQRFTSNNVLANLALNQYYFNFPRGTH